MKILIIGASGLVGGNMYKLFLEKEHEVIGTHQAFSTSFTQTFDASLDYAKVSSDFYVNFAPDVIINCAALTNVDYCETHQEESFQKTVVSSQNIVSLAERVNSKLIYISTDYVFDGSHGPYIEDDSVNPINVYGRHKLLAEEIANRYPDSLILRVTNVYGNECRNKNFVSRIINTIEQGNYLSLKLPIDQYATPVNAYDIAKVADLLIQNNKTGIYHVGSTDYYNRYQLAKKILKYFKNYQNYKIETFLTAELKQSALRPLLGGLVSKKLLNEFPTFEFTNIDDYLSSI